MYESIKEKKENKFYPVIETEIVEAQINTGVIIPNDLKVFYKEVGYGFLKSEVDNFNRIMDPGSVCDFRLRQGQFDNDPELEMYVEDEKDRLFFFEICEGYYLSIGFSKNNYGKIFNGKEMIADNLGQFLTKYQDNERFFVE